MSIRTQAAEICATGISRHFGSFVALDDISLTVARGEFLTLLGPSGSGKTTFLMVLAGFSAPTHGSLTLDGRNVTDVPAEERGFGMVFQGYALFPHMSVEQNIAFPLKVQRRNRTAVRKRVAEMIDMVGLGGHGHKKPAALSGGQQQRVALARALACEPSVLLLDEPFSALDKNLRGQMQDEMRRLHRETGTTFVFVTHDQSEALALSSRVAIFDKGKLQQIGVARDVYEMPENRFVAEFLGDINILPMTSITRSGDVTTGIFEDQALRATSAVTSAGTSAGSYSVTSPSDRASAPVSSMGALAIRPEYMQITPVAPASGNSLKVHVVDITYLGAQSRLALESDGGTALSLTTSTATLPGTISPGSQLCVAWPVERGFFLGHSPSAESSSNRS